ncbi:MAG: UbiD family decarboxylase [Betaproteobacteria bacterium]|nr:UbiD family decarboxylase [Betaproteobacteria bacterium]
MPFADLREFLGFLEAKEELLRIREEVDPKFQIAAYIRKTSDVQGPALYFENVKGSSMPVVGGLFATTQRLLLALGVPDHGQAVRALVESMKNPIAPVLVPGGPCRDVVYKGDEVDLGKLPIPTYSTKDAGPYITMGLVISRDPETGSRNLAIYRLQIKGRNRIGILSQQLSLQLSRAEAKGRGLEVAIALGTSPELLIGSQWRAPYGVEELGLACGLHGSAIELTKAVSVDIDVPATAEIVIEGVIRPKEREIEGPFGEFTGYYQPASPKPVIEVTAITHRQKPVFLAGLTGMPTTDNHVMKQVPIEASHYLALKQQFPGLKAVHFPNCGGANFLLIVSIKKSQQYEARSLIAAAMSLASAKYVIVVDEDVDVYNLENVLWAVSNRSQPDQDVMILPRLLGGPLDPSASSHRTTAVMGIDATVPIDRPFPEMVEIPGMDKVPDFLAGLKKT